MKINWNKIIIKNKTKTNPYENIKGFIKKDSYSNLNKLIEVKNIKHEFKKKVIYENISFEIFENERLAFLGPNGSGKTLTISTLSGIYKPKSGEIKYCYEFDKKPEEKISVQFQDLQFPSSLSPKDIIDFCMKLQNFNETEENIIEILKIFELYDIINTPISKLSGGQQQRINVFLAIIGKPKILILDEFTTGLDISIKNKIKDFIIDYCNKNKTTLILISHDIDCIESMVDRIILLANKQILVDAPVSEINKEFGDIKSFLKQYILN